jgi:hypothetical protein
MTMTLSGTEWGLRAPFPLPWPGRPRSHRPLELGWYRSHWLPHCDGRRAEVRLHNGVVEIVVPWLDDPDPTPCRPMGAWPATSATSRARPSIA